MPGHITASESYNIGFSHNWKNWQVNPNLGNVQAYASPTLIKILEQNTDMSTYIFLEFISVSVCVGATALMYFITVTKIFKTYYCIQKQCLKKQDLLSIESVIFRC